MNQDLRREIINSWAGGKPVSQQIIILAEKVRDIPYGVIGSRAAEDVFQKNMGTCSGKHNLLKELYQELGIKTQDSVAMHRFKNMSVEFPSDIKEILNRSDIVDPHNFFKMEVDGNWIIVDVTWDKPLKKLGFTVTENWDGKTDMPIAVVADEIIETNDPLAIKEEKIGKLPAEVQADRELFLKKLSDWLKTQRL